MNFEATENSRAIRINVRAFFVAYAPILFGTFFLFAAVMKLVYPSPATMGLESLEVPYRVAKNAIATVIIIELYLGLLLLFKIDLKFALSSAMALIFLFLGYLWYLTTLAHPPSCGCIGLTGIFQSTKAEAFLGVFRNCLLIWGLHWTCQNCVPLAAETEVAPVIPAPTPIQ